MKIISTTKLEKSVHYILNIFICGLLGYLILTSILKAYGTKILYTRQEVFILFIYRFIYISFVIMSFSITKSTSKLISDLLNGIGQIIKDTFAEIKKISR